MCYDDTDEYNPDFLAAFTEKENADKYKKMRDANAWKTDIEIIETSDGCDILPSISIFGRVVVRGDDSKLVVYASPTNTIDSKAQIAKTDRVRIDECANGDFIFEYRKIIVNPNPEKDNEFTYKDVVKRYATRIHDLWLAGVPWSEIKKQIAEEVSEEENK
jgi:hypothetical protein